MKTKTSSSGRRAKDKTTLTISLPKELKKTLEEAAENDDRTLSNYLVHELTKMLKGVNVEQTTTHRDNEEK